MDCVLTLRGRLHFPKDSQIPTFSYTNNFLLTLKFESGVLGCQ